MRVSSLKLAREVAARLNAVVPVPFRLTADGAQLLVYADEKLDSIKPMLEIVEDQDRELEERLATALTSVLSNLQDDISERLRTPWPSVDGRIMASVGVGTNAEWINLWYGEEAAPVIKMSPIRIADILT